MFGKSREQFSEEAYAWRGSLRGSTVSWRVLGEMGENSVKWDWGGAGILARVRSFVLGPVMKPILSCLG